MIKRLLIIRYPFPSPNILRNSKTRHHWGFLGNFLLLFHQWDVRFPQQCVCVCVCVWRLTSFGTRHLLYWSIFTHRSSLLSSSPELSFFLVSYPAGLESITAHEAVFLHSLSSAVRVYSRLLGCKAKGKSLWSVTVLSRVAQLHAAMTDCPRQEDICEFPQKLLVSWYVRTCRLVNGYCCFEG